MASRVNDRVAAGPARLDQRSRACGTARRRDRIAVRCGTDGQPADRELRAYQAALCASCLAALPALKQTRGRIVLVGSVAGVIYTPGNIYGATKWAVTGLAENTRRMVTGDGVGVTLINPGAVETNFFDAGGGLPDRAMLTADQLARTIVWAIT